MQAAAIVLAITAAGGAALAAIRLSGVARPPTWMAMGHGTLGATGLGLLAYAAATTSLPTPALVALGLFALATAGGLTIFLGFHLRERPLPIPLIIGHGLIALTALISLAVAILQP